MNSLIYILTIILIIILFILGGYLLRHRKINLLTQKKVNNQYSIKLLSWIGSLLIILAVITLGVLLAQAMIFLVAMLIIDAILVTLLPFIILVFFPKNN
ncbi:hypothetical protein [Liquorilactobacillus vini]|uniref:Uncharacterized protein n=1 Tax=Liquorilactobacillus vini DSM 20605 TaxID=1133569 RepID=A0A0R2CC23_9LACO|nr:hypothetical protein [Liquorilactobacillus vini]KRM89127.1 hypothetical protein FD21_GL000287 [Liquorilactobacillus vini DSM 20605]